jgi:hypothetical protein
LKAANRQARERAEREARRYEGTVFHLSR